MDEQLREAIQQLLRAAEDMDELVTDLRSALVARGGWNKVSLAPQLLDRAIEDVRREIRRLDLEAMKRREGAKQEIERVRFTMSHRVLDEEDRLG